MSEPTSTATVAAASAASGTASLPLLAALGIDFGALVFGLVGCVIAQCLIPSSKPEDRKLLRIAAVTIGSTLFAGIVAPVITPVQLGTWLGFPVAPHAAANLIAAGVGAFAQPLALIIKARILAFAPKVPGEGAQTEK